MKQKLTTLKEEIDGVFYSLDNMYYTSDIQSLKDQFNDAKNGQHGTIDETIEVMQEILGEARFILNEFFAGIEPFDDQVTVGYPNTLGY